jgi:hypothetical protein
MHFLKAAAIASECRGILARSLGTAQTHLERPPGFSFIVFFGLMICCLIMTGGNLFAAPVITTVSPGSGPVGAAITITGSGFSATAASNTVYFGAVKATVTASTAGTITTTVPVGATYSPITVTVANLTAYSGAPFLVTFTGCVLPNGISSASLSGRYNFTADTVSNRGVILADLDLDGRPDAVVTEVWRNNIAVFHNTNPNPAPLTLATFAARVNYPTDPGAGGFGDGRPYYIAAGDLDGDGKLDLAVVNYAANTISIFRNTSVPGTISFAPRIDIPTGGVNPDCIAIGDMNADGKPDLIIGYFGSAYISVFKNTTVGTSITMAAPANFTSLSQTTDLAIGDMDGDGKLDVEVVGSYPSPSTEIQNYRNTSSGGTITFSANYYTIPMAIPVAIALGDLNGDGKLDAVTSNRSPSGTYNTINVNQNSSTPGSIAFVGTQVTINTIGEPGDVAITDMNGDGKPDIVFSRQVNSINDGLCLMENTSTTFPMTFNAPVLFTADHAPYGVAVGDIDGDGRPDVLDSHPNYNVMSAWHNICSPDTSHSTVDSTTCTPAPANLVAWWPFDESTHPAASTTVDLTSVATAYAPTNANNFATVVGTVGGGGYVSNGLGFNGTSGNYLTAASAGLDFGTTSFSIDAWIKIADTSMQRKTIISKRVVGATHSTGYTLYINEQHQLNLQLGNGTSNPGFALGPVPLNAWTFVAATIDRTPSSGALGGRVTLYLNNTSQSFALPAIWTTYSFANTNPLWIGQLAPSTYPDDPFNGNIDELEIFKAAVDTGVLYKIYRAHQAGKCRVLAAVPGTGDHGCCDTATFGVAASQVVNCFGCYPNNRDWRSVNVTNRTGHPINSITIQYSDCNHNLITGAQLAQLTGQSVHVVRDVPYLNHLMTASHFPSPFGYISDISAPPSPSNESLVSFDLGLPCNATPNCWSIRLLIEHKNPSAPTGLDTCYVTLPDWKPCPSVIRVPTWRTAKIDSPIYVVKLTLDEGTAGAVGYVSFATADSTDTILGGSGGTWASQVNPLDPDSSNPRVASFLQSHSVALYHLIPDSTGMYSPTFNLFIGAGKNGQDRKYRPTIIRAIYDQTGGLLLVDTISLQGSSSIVGAIKSGDANGFQIVSIYPNPSRDVTHINYVNSENEHVRLEIINTLGEVVSTVEEGMQLAGMHAATFNTQGLLTGTYYCRLSSDTKVHSAPFVIVR